MVAWFLLELRRLNVFLQFFFFFLVLLQATVCYKREKNCNTDSSREEYKNVMLYRKEVPWYLVRSYHNSSQCHKALARESNFSFYYFFCSHQDDGTGRVYVTGAQFAKGFYDTLKRYIFTEPVTEHFERFFSFKDVQVLNLLTSRINKYILFFSFFLTCCCLVCLVCPKQLL